jgi:hypothetical protein
MYVYHYYVICSSVPGRASTLERKGKKGKEIFAMRRKFEENKFHRKGN